MGLRAEREHLAAQVASKQGAADAHAGVSVRVRERQSPHVGGVQGGELAELAVGAERENEGKRVRERSPGNAAIDAAIGASPLRFGLHTSHTAGKAGSRHGLERTPRVRRAPKRGNVETG